MSDLVNKCWIEYWLIDYWFGYQFHIQLSNTNSITNLINKCRFGYQLMNKILINLLLIRSSNTESVTDSITIYWFSYQLLFQDYPPCITLQLHRALHHMRPQQSPAIATTDKSATNSSPGSKSSAFKDTSSICPLFLVVVCNFKTVSLHEKLCFPKNPRPLPQCHHQVVNYFKTIYHLEELCISRHLNSLQC